MESYKIAASGNFGEEGTQVIALDQTHAALIMLRSFSPGI